MKLFKSSNVNVINDSRYRFNFELPSELLMKRKDKSIEKFMDSQSLLDYFAIHAVTDRLSIHHQQHHLIPRIQ